MRSGSGRSRKLQTNHTLRTAVSILFIFNTVLLTCTVSCFVFLLKKQFYTTGADAYRNEITDRLMEIRSMDALQYYSDYLSGESQNSRELEQYKESFSEQNSNFYFLFSSDDHQDYNFRNYDPGPDGYAYSYKPDLNAFFKSSDNTYLVNALANAYHLTFEGYLRKDMKADDMFWRSAQFFALTDMLKYTVIALLVFFALVECLIGLLLFSAAARREDADTDAAHMRDIDHIPMYFLAPFFAIMAGVCVYFLNQQTAVLSDVSLFFLGSETFNTVLRPALYISFLLLAVLAFLLHAMLTTVSVRLRSPAWWRRSILYRAFSGNLDHRVRMTLAILTVAEVGLCLASILLQNTRHAVPGWALLLTDAAFSAAASLLLYIVVKDMRIYIPAAHRIAIRQSGYIPTQNLSDSARHHAENINFLSRSASAETEKRFINENFSTKLIHNISHGLREPLKTVAEHVRLLEERGLPPDEERRHIREIDTLSQELKKTIEDLILISKATTGNLPFDPVPTDAGTMLSQAIGEFYEKFENRGIVPVTEQPPQPVMLLADGQYMWYIFEGVLSVMLELAVPGTRLFLSADRAGERAMLQFRCTVCADAEKQIVELSGMGLSLAKAFTFLQNGAMYDKLSHDTLHVTLLFPQGTE